MSYAAIAASDTLAQNPLSAKNVLIRPHREVTVNIKNLATIQILRAMNQRDLKAQVERAIQQSEHEQINSIKVMSSNQLRSGDLGIRTTGSREAQILRTHMQKTGFIASWREPRSGIQRMAC